MPYHDRLAQLSNLDFIALWNAAETTDEVVARVVARVGRVPRWAVVARGVALRRGGNVLKTFGPAPPTTAIAPPSASPSAA